MVPTIRRLYAACAALSIAAALYCLPDPASAANAFPSIEPSLALVGSVGRDGTLDSLGTAFCVSAAGTTSYFITNNHVVTDDNGKPLTSMIAILARDMNDPNPRRYRARIVRRSADPDLAVVEVDVSGIPPVHISTSLPQVGDDIAIAGFPYNESVLWGHLFGGSGLRLDRRFPPEITPSEHKGAVSAIHGGSYYIQYDAVTDSGNSGGPLFDPSSGEVYGVVQASVEGAREYRGIPSSIHNNLAISIREGWQFIAQSPVTIDSGTVAAANAQHFSTANARCGHIQGRRVHTQAEIAALKANLTNPRYASKRAVMQRALTSYQRALRKIGNKCA